MAGVKGRSGRKRKSIDEHVAAGTYRADRHGPIPSVQSTDLASRPQPRAKSACGRPQKWSRSAADEYAISNGCWFDEQQAAYVVDWFRAHLHLSDSIWSGQPFELQPWQRDEIIYPLFGWMRKDERGQVVRRFNSTYIQIPKKNGKSTLASGIGLYMLVGEGNRGNEVYSAATDKEQAGIVHGEAIRMVQASPKLSACLKINHTTRHLYNTELGITYKAVASRPAGNEGLKGNCAIIDELHAWNGDELWNALKYMGRAWPERLIFIITTAGDDQESVCYRQYETAKAVQSGAIQTDKLLVCIHEAAPGDDIRDEAVQRRANPSLGHTILKSDLDDDIAEAEKSARTLAVLKRYRFNVWTTTTAAWLDPHAWAAAAESVEDGELIGLPCWSALDLARTRDSSAFSMLFRCGEFLYLKSHFWLPEAAAEKWDHLVSFRDWAEAGWLTLTPGDVTDYRQIEQDVTGLIQSYGVRQVAFDPHYAEEVTQRLVEGTGCERLAFPQTIVSFGRPTAEFERMLISGELKHDGNPMLAWQASHVQTWSDFNQNIRPVKPKRDSHKTVDGIVTGVMAVGTMLREPAPPESVYTLPESERPIWV